MSKLDEIKNEITQGIIENNGIIKLSDIQEVIEKSARAFLELAKENATPLDPHSVTQSYETQVISIDKLKEFFK